MSRLILAQELKTHSIAELFSLLAAIDQELACSKAGSHQRSNAIASHENVQRELNRRLSRHLQPVASP
ncbi:hypothetical protein [Methyloligella solikamskensis]|uniref:Uncharacterized protein n=1 Tax=Methyloligella solikamskensis TaxID=1177756 RepID=A0ABW3J815_9HYPH